MPLPTAYGTVPIGGALPEAYIDPFIPISTTDGANNLPTGYGVLIPAVSMTAAASGSSGITVADDDDIDFGTGDFSIHWEGALPDWTPASSLTLVRKNTSAATAGFILGVSGSSAGTIFLQLREGGGADDAYTSTAATAITDGGNAKITTVCVRETALTDGSVTHYVNGVQLGTARTITAATPFSISNALAAYISGTSAVRNASTTRALYLYNRALSAAEVLSLCNNGVDAADVGASQTAIYTSDFSAGVDGWTGSNVTLTGNIDGVAAVDNTLRCVISSTGAGRYVSKTIGIPANSSYEFYLGIIFPSGNAALDSFDIRNQSGNAVISGAVQTNLTKGVWHYFRFSGNTANAATSLRVYLSDSGGGTSASATGGDIAYVAVFNIKKTGCTSELLAENAQSNTGQVLDTSGNKQHAMLPAAGASVLGKPNNGGLREVRWTNTWSGTNELQYIGGVNQAVWPTNAKIESISCVISGTTVEDFTIGDGSDADRYVALTTGIAAGTNVMTLTATPFTDGTNLKLTIDPDANATMSVATTVRYTLLE
jgi:hypothetical protein